MSKYTEFVKMHYHDKKYAGLSPQMTMKALAADYRKMNPAKTMEAKPRARKMKAGAVSAGSVSAGGIGSDIGTAVDAIGSLFGLGLEKKKGSRKAHSKAHGGATSAGELMAGQESAGAVAGRLRKGRKDVRGSGAISSALASLLPF
jgi:hypothetical protein